MKNSMLKMTAFAILFACSLGLSACSGGGSSSSSSSGSGSISGSAI